MKHQIPFKLSQDIDRDAGKGKRCKVCGTICAEFLSCTLTQKDRSRWDKYDLLRSFRAPERNIVPDYKFKHV